MRIIYLDVLFIVNLAINYLLLRLTGNFSGIYITRKRTLLGAVFGAFFSIILFFCDFKSLPSVLAKLMLCISIIIVTFFPAGKGRLTKLSFIFCILSFSLAGAIFAIGYLDSDSILKINNGIPYINISVKLLIVAAAASYGILTLIFGNGSVKLAKEVKKVSLTLENRHIVLKTFVDTGNLLRDPISGKQIIVVDKHMAAMLFDEPDAGCIANLRADNAISCFESISDGNRLRFGFISHTGTAEKSNLMLTVKVDSITINEQHFDKYLIGISPVSIDAACGCNAIIGV